MHVQVKNVRDDGNVDLGWSIRQHESEFRGKLIDTPEGDELPEEDEPEEADGSDDASSTDGGTASGSPEPAAPTAGGGSAGTATGGGTETAGSDGGGGTEAASVSVSIDELERTPVADLDDPVGEAVLIEGSVIEARQTTGPTVFEIRDETGTVDCAAFESAGVRAYPEIEAGDAARIAGVVEERRGDLQIETEDAERLEGEEAETIERRLEEAIEARARPGEVDLLADHDPVAAVREGIVEAATAIRRAIVEGRPVVLRHNATVDGYAAAAAIERAAIPLVRSEHEAEDATYHYVSRRPLDGRIYGMRDAIRDVTNMLDAEERHEEPTPLFVFVNAGSTAESGDGFDLLGTYGADRVVIDAAYPDAEMEAAASVFVSPHLAGSEDAESATSAALGANVAAHVSTEARRDVSHLPAVSYWRGGPEAYADLAAEVGYDAEGVATVREAIALEAFYGTYDDKRELVSDILFGDRDLAKHASEQFRERVESELRTAGPHLRRTDAGGATLGVLDVDAFTNTYDFPPAETLLAELAARNDDLAAVIGVDEDRLLAVGRTTIDMREVGKRVADAVPEGGVETRGGRDGRLVFLTGEREAVIAAAVEAVGDQVA
jgi:RecJ-like exonuclease